MNDYRKVFAKQQDYPSTIITSSRLTDFSHFTHFRWLKLTGAKLATCIRSKVRIACSVKCHRLKGGVLIIHFCTGDSEKKKQI